MTTNDKNSVSSKVSPSLNLTPLMFETFVCTMTFVAVAGLIARKLELAAWQIDAAMTMAGVAWAAGIALAIVGMALTIAQIVLRKHGRQPERLIRVVGVIAAIGFVSAVAARFHSGQAPLYTLPGLSGRCRICI